MSATAPLGIQVAQRAVTGTGEPWGDTQLESLPQAELLQAHRALAESRRRLDAEFAAASAELERRSDPADGAAGLARRQGFSTPTQMIASVTGGSTAEAGRLIAVGKATRPAAKRDPEDGGAATAAQPRFPMLAAAVNAGKLSIDSAGAISAMLERVASGAEAEVLARAEAHLVERAQHLPFNKLCAVIRQCEARFDADTHAKDEEVRRQARYLNVFETRNGMVMIDGRLDVETAAPLRAAIDGIVNDALRRRRDAQSNGDGAGAARPDGPDQPASPDERSVPQMRADALADLARHSLGCEAPDLPLAKTTVVVRMGLDDLRDESGFGEIEGTDQPLSITAMRRMAADAEVIPMVLGGEGELLELGRARRLFSRAQRMALTERDGGCAFCHAPPSFTEAHHIRWWERDRGPTNLDNGVMLCTSCHHRVHRDHWEISVRDGTVWFTPPSAVDRERVPIRGGRQQFEYGARDHAHVTLAA
jgi:hypothetical protein